MRTLAVIQARMGSTRLPGKVLSDVGGRSLLELMLARLSRLAVDDLVVAIPDGPGDDRLAEVAHHLGATVVLGPEHDVLERFRLALAAHPADEVVRLTADCPLLDPGIVEAAIRLRRETEADYAGNTPMRSFPDGLDVEVLRADVLEAVAAEAQDRFDREHVTRFVLQRPQRFRLANLSSGQALGGERWTVDTAADLALVRSLVAHVDDPHTASWREILAVARRQAADEVIAVQRHVVADVSIDELSATSSHPKGPA